MGVEDGISKRHWKVSRVMCMFGILVNCNLIYGGWAFFDDTRSVDNKFARGR